MLSPYFWSPSPSFNSNFPSYLKHFMNQSLFVGDMVMLLKIECGSETKRGLIGGALTDREAMGPPRSGAGVGVGMRGPGNSLI